LHGSVEEFGYVGDVEIMLIESSEEEDFVRLNGSAEGSSALLLPAMRIDGLWVLRRLWTGRLAGRRALQLEGHKVVGCAESAVADVIHASAVPVIGAGLCDYVDDCAAGAS
jgi:hypothetical protein